MEGRPTTRPPRATLLLLAGLVSACAFLHSCARLNRVARVGVVSNLDFFNATFDGFKSRMTELGWEEGRRISYDFRRTRMDMAATEAALSGFSGSKVDLILAFPTEAALLAKKAGEASRIPVLFANANIEGLGLVESVQRPGGNATGVRFPGPDIAVKRLEILSEIAPRARRFLVPYQRGVDLVPAQLEALRAAAAAAGLRRVELPMDSPAALASWTAGLPVSGPPPFDAVLMIAEPLMVSPGGFGPLASWAYGRGLPVGGALMEEGGAVSLFEVATDAYESGRQAAALADKILKGAKAGEIPVLSAEYNVIVDAGAGRRMGVAIPPGVLNAANEVR